MGQGAPGDGSNTECGRKATSGETVWTMSHANGSRFIDFRGQTRWAAAVPQPNNTYTYHRHFFIPWLAKMFFPPLNPPGSSDDQGGYSAKTTRVRSRKEGISSVDKKLKKHLNRKP